MAVQFLDDPVVPGGTVTLSIGGANFGWYDAYGIYFSYDLNTCIPGLAPAGSMPKSNIFGNGSTLSFSDGILTLFNGYIGSFSENKFLLTLSIPANTMSGTYIFSIGEFIYIWEISSQRSGSAIPDTLIIDASLPVELTDISATPENGVVMIRWSSCNEVDNLGYIIERNDGFWRTIASYETDPTLCSQGNTSSQQEYQYIDNDVHPGETYIYRLSDVSMHGEITHHPPLTVTLMALPNEAIMEKAHPNPFNPRTLIRYSLNNDTEVTLSIYDIRGRLVSILHESYQVEGSYQVYWNGENSIGQKMPSGIYMIQLSTNDSQQVQKVLLTK